MRAAATWALVFVGMLGMLGMLGIAPPAWASPPEPEPVFIPPSEAPLNPGPRRPLDGPMLPTYDEAPLAPDTPFDDAPLEVEEDPPTGRGRTAVGAILLGGGATLTSVSAIMIARDTDLAVWIPGMVLGGGALITGGLLVVSGHLRHKSYRGWAAHNIAGPVPARGDGMLAGGFVCTVAGTIGTVIGGVSIVAFQAEDDPPYGQVMIPLGLASVVTGVSLLAAGSVRHKKFRRWHDARPTPSFSLLPGPRQSIGGLSFGFAGRF